MGLARVPVSPELLADVLHFPPGTEIVGACYDWQPGPVITLLVRHEDFEDVPEGAALPTKTAIYERRNAPRLLPEQQEVIFVGWGS